MVNGIKGFNRLFPKMASKQENDLDKAKNLALKGTAFTKSKNRPYSEMPIPVTMSLNSKLKSLADGQRTNAIASGLPTVRKYFDYSSKDRRNELIVVLPEMDTDSPRMMTSPSESDDEHEAHAINLEKEETDENKDNTEIDQCFTNEEKQLQNNICSTETRETVRDDETEGNDLEREDVVVLERTDKRVVIQNDALEMKPIDDKKISLENTTSASLLAALHRKGTINRKQHMEPIWNVRLLMSLRQQKNTHTNRSLSPIPERPKSNQLPHGYRTIEGRRPFLAEEVNRVLRTWNPSTKKMKDTEKLMQTEKKPLTISAFRPTSVAIMRDFRVFVEEKRPDGRFPPIYKETGVYRQYQTEW